jgi:hypothetical protein
MHTRASLFIFILTVTLVAGAQSVFAGVPDFQPIVPVPGITDATDGKGTISFAEYVENMFRLSISIGAILAVMMIIVGGFEYMTSEALGGKKGGISKLQNAVLGLVLLLAVVLVLQVINPCILEINAFSDGETACSPEIAAPEAIVPTEGDPTTGGLTDAPLGSVLDPECMGPVGTLTCTTGSPVPACVDDRNVVVATGRTACGEYRRVDACASTCRLPVAPSATQCVAEGEVLCANAVPICIGSQSVSLSSGNSGSRGTITVPRYWPRSGADCPAGETKSVMCEAGGCGDPVLPEGIFSEGDVGGNCVGGADATCINGAPIPICHIRGDPEITRAEYEYKVRLPGATCREGTPKFMCAGACAQAAAPAEPDPVFDLTDPAVLTEENIELGNCLPSQVTTHFEVAYCCLNGRTNCVEKEDFCDTGRVSVAACQLREGGQ